MKHEPVISPNDRNEPFVNDMEDGEELHGGDPVAASFQASEEVQPEGNG